MAKHNSTTSTILGYLLKIHLEAVICIEITMAEHSSTTAMILKLPLEDTSWSCRLHENHIAKHSSTTSTILELPLKDTSWSCHLHRNHNGWAQFNHCNDIEVTSWRYILKLSSAWKSQWLSKVQPLQWSWSCILEIHLEAIIYIEITMAKHSSTTVMTLKLMLPVVEMLCILFGHSQHMVDCPSAVRRNGFCCYKYLVGRRCSHSAAGSWKIRSIRFQK